MTNFTDRFKVGTAAAAIAAIAAAGVLTPTAVAHADDDITASSAQGLGGSASLATAYLEDSVVDEIGLTETEFNGPFQNKWIWIGYSNPEPPVGVTHFELQPILLTAVLPGYFRELIGWFTKDINWEFCALGAAVKFGPYGSITGSTAQSC